MRALFTLLCLWLCPLVAVAGILGNTMPALTGEDSLSLVFVSLDSTGNPASADSLFLVISDPSGVETCRDSMTTTDSRLEGISIGGATSYRFSDAVSTLTGSGSMGRYSVLAILKRADGLATAQTHWFQLLGQSLSQRLAYLDANISGIGTGGGAWTVTVAVRDTTTGAAIPYAGLAVRNLDQTTLLAGGRSDVNGLATFNLDNGSYLVTATASGYIFEPPDTLVVDGATTDTVAAGRFDPGSPAAPELCRVYGWVYTIDGYPDADATVSIRLAGSDIRCNGLIVSPFAIETTTDSTGSFALDVYPSAALQPPGTPYEISINRSSGGIVRQRITVPSLSSWQLTW